MVLAAPVVTSEITYSQTDITQSAQTDEVGFAARAPPMAVSNITITGGVAVMQGSAFALHGQETVAALFGFGRDLVAPNNGVLPSGSGNYAPDHLPGFDSQVDPRFPDRVSGPTQGVVDTPVGPVYLQSGVNGPASGYNNPDLPAVNQASSHVEGHAAALMNQNGITDMTVTINNVGGPCGNCLSQVPDMLPTGSTLNVRWMDADGALQVTTIPGRAN